MDDLPIALTLADIADSITMKYFKHSITAYHKPDSSIVTNVDIEVQDKLADYLRKLRPGDSILGEEKSRGVDPPGTSGRCWIIDPLDHTSNYVRGIESFGTLIALEMGEQQLAAVISAPALERRWWASKGEGAYSTKGALRVSGIGQWSEAYATFAAIDHWEARGHLHNISRLARTATYTYGSGGFMGHMRVAEGQIEASLDPWGEPWDNAAVRHIVEEAGGRFSDLTGAATIFGGCAIVTNGRLHEHVLRELTSPDHACNYDLEISK